MSGLSLTRLAHNSGWFGALRKRQDNPRKILVVSIQKCGTHLLERVLREAGLEPAPGCNGPADMSQLRRLKPGQFLVSHFCPQDDVQMALENGDTSIKLLFNFRDPRDVLVSWFHWMHPSNPKPMHAHMRYMQKVYRSFSDDELIKIFTTGDKFRAVEYNPIEHFRHSRVLLFHPGVLNVRFEELVGPNGGGDKSSQVRVIQQIQHYLGLRGVDPEWLAERAFSTNSPTFRKGRVGGYRDSLSAQQLARFERLHGDLLEQYGYPADCLRDKESMGPK